MSNYYAHSVSGQPEDHWEPLADHLRLAADGDDRFPGAAGFAAAFGDENWGRVAGLWHDLGKYSAEFQEYLRTPAAEDEASRARRGPDHATAGAQHAMAQCLRPMGTVLAYCIAGHHGGLPDAEDDAGGRSGLNARLRKTVDPFGGAPRELLEAPCPTVPALNWGNTNLDLSFRLSVFCRMLFSCLVDADFLATEQFMRPDRAERRSGATSTAPELLDVLNTHLAELEQKSKPTPVNLHRRAVLAACRTKATLPPGLFSLTVPTGGGKTLSSLAFALTHAVRHGLRRVIYAIPFTSIIEQNAHVFREALAAAGENVVLEHHVNYERKKDGPDASDDEETYWDWLASENWDAPVVATTNVQLFESLFASKPSRCRKLHRVARSVIVLDEVQTLPVTLLRPTLAMLEELCRNYGCTVVLCSATQPAVALRDGFPIGLPDVREIIDDAPALFSALKRVDVERIGKIEDGELASRLAGHHQVLCVVNTRSHAAELFGLLKRESPADHIDDAFHLSAQMCPAHRDVVLKRIGQRLDQKKPCRVVSTQLVEAGVDIDFPVVYRAMTGVDSIAQAAGRCNREGRLDRGRVFVFETHVDPRGDLRLRRQTGAEVAERHVDLLGLEAVEHYFSLLYWSRQDEWDKHEIMKCFSYSNHGLHAQFRRAASEYRLIRDEQHPVIVPYGDKGKRLIDDLRSMYEPPGRGFSRRAQRFTVGVHAWQLEKLRQATLVNLYHERFWGLEAPKAYDKELGLRIDLTGRDPNTLIV